MLLSGEDVDELEDEIVNEELKGWMRLKQWISGGHTCARKSLISGMKNEMR
jgi:hypothetical protein